MDKAGSTGSDEDQGEGRGKGEGGSVKEQAREVAAGQDVNNALTESTESRGKVEQQTLSVCLDTCCRSPNTLSRPRSLDQLRSCQLPLGPAAGQGARSIAFLKNEG